jgi:trimeric autotransporter adhesin
MACLNKFSFGVKGLFFGILWMFPALSMAQYFDTAFWVPNGPVNAISQYGNEVYLGGRFSYVGKSSGYGLVLDTLNGNPAIPGFPEVDGPVYCVYPDSWGGWYIGGDFGLVGGQPRQNLAHIAKNGYLYPSFNPMPDGPVYAIWVLPSNPASNIPRPNIYVGGDFTFIGGQNRSNIAILNPYDGTPYDNWKPLVNGPVYAIEPKGKNSLYIGGAFTKVDGLTRNNVAELSQLTGNLSNPHILRSFNPNVNGAVFSLFYSRGNLFAGGTFLQVDSKPFKFLVKYNTLSNRVDTTFLASPSGPVYCFGRWGQRNNWSGNSGGPSPGGRLAADSGEFSSISVFNNSLFIGGNFGTVSGSPRGNIALIDTASGLVQPYTFNTNGIIYSIAVSPLRKYVFVAGSFTNAGNNSRRNLAKSDSIGNSLPFLTQTSDPVRSVSINDSLLYVGGDFVCINGTERNNLAAIDISTGQASGFSIGADGEIFALAIAPDGKLYAAGSFGSLGGSPRGRIGCVDLGTQTVTSFNPNSNGTIRTLAVLNGKVYFGGSFNLVGGNSRRNAGAADRFTGAVLNWYPDANGTLNSMVSGTDRIFAGGFFNEIGGLSRNNLAALDTISGYSIPSFNPAPDQGVYSCYFDGSNLYFGGWFSKVGTVTRKNVAAVHGVSGALSGFNPAPNGFVRSVGLFLPGIIYGGDFSESGGQNRTRVAVSPNQGTGVSAYNISANRSPMCYLKVGNKIAMGGKFTAINGDVHAHFVMLDPGFVPGFSEPGNNLSVTLFPNPARETINLVSKSSLKVLNVTVTDISGQILISPAIRNLYPDAETSVSINHLPCGMYFLNLETESGRSSYRFIKID